MKTLLTVLAGFLLIVAVLAGLIYVVFGIFWLEFIALTIVYIGIFLMILLGIKSYYGGNFWDYVWSKEHNSNNNWFYALMGATAITFLIALNHFGPALALPTTKVTGTVYHDVTFVFQHILWGKEASKMGLEAPSHVLPWASGTWFWWQALGMYILITLGYIPFAFYDEMVAAFHFTKEEIRKHHDKALAKKREQHSSLVEKIQAINKRRKKGEPETPVPQPPPDKLRFEQFMEVGVVIEIFLAVVKFMRESKEA